VHQSIAILEALMQLGEDSLTFHNDIPVLLAALLRSYFLDVFSLVHYTVSMSKAQCANILQVLI